MQVKKDSLKIGGIVVGALTVPVADISKVRLSGLGDFRPDPVHRPAGDVIAFDAGQEGFDGSGLALVVPRLETAAPTATILFAGRHNAFVNQGLQDVLDSAYGDLVADRITHIGLSADAQAVTATTTSLDPAGGATGTSIKVTANTSRTNQTVHADQTWTQADVSWAIAKIGLLSSSAATDVCNIIGGTGGSSPYNEPFTIDLTSIATWSLTMGIDVTATAS